MVDAKILRIVDGDTVEVEISKLKLRLDFIDAPETRGVEKDQGLITKEWLQKRLEKGDIVQLDIKDFDMYNRALTVLYKDGINVNGELLKKQLAEVYSPSSHNNGIND